MKNQLSTKESPLTGNELKKIAAGIPQIAYLSRASEWTPAEDDIQLYSHEECLADKKSKPAIFVTLKKNRINMLLPVSLRQ